MNQPIKWCAIDLIREFLKNKQLEKSTNVLNQFIQVAFKYLISKDRKGRLEYVDALKSIRENQKEKMVENNPISMAVRK